LIPDLRDPFDFVPEPLAKDVPVDLRGWKVKANGRVTME
jgi:hypothetical protein